MRVQRIAEVARMDGSVADLAEVRTAMPRDGSEPSPAAMPAADMRMTEAMTTEMTATEMTATVMSTTVTAATMTTTVATTALCQRRTCQQASQRHRGNSSDRSQHLTLPQIRTSETPERFGIWNRPVRRKFPCR